MNFKEIKILLVIIISIVIYRNSEFIVPVFADGPKFAIEYIPIKPIQPNLENLTEPHEWGISYFLDSVTLKKVKEIIDSKEFKDANAEANSRKEKIKVVLEFTKRNLSYNRKKADIIRGSVGKEHYSNEFEMIIKQYLFWYLFEDERIALLNSYRHALGVKDSTLGNYIEEGGTVCFHYSVFASILAYYAGIDDLGIKTGCNYDDTFCHAWSIDLETGAQYEPQLGEKGELENWEYIPSLTVKKRNRSEVQAGRGVFLDLAKM